MEFRVWTSASKSDDSELGIASLVDCEVFNLCGLLCIEPGLNNVFGIFVLLRAKDSIECILLPLRSSNLNGYMECWFRILKYECLNHFIFFGRRRIERAMREYVKHDHTGETLY